MNSSYDIGVYPYDDYIENNFFEMIDSFKENKKELKDFLNDLVLVKVENHFGDAENSYSTFFRKGNIEEMFGIFDYSDDKVEIFELNLKEKEFEENYDEFKKGDFSKLDVENSEENHIYNIEKTYEINPKEQIPFDTEKMLETIIKGTSFIKNHLDPYNEIVFSMTLTNDVNYNEYKLTSTPYMERKFEMKENELNVFLDKTYKFLELNDVSIVFDLGDRQNGGAYDHGNYANIPDDEKEEAKYRLRYEGYNNISHLTTRNIEEEPLKNSSTKEVNISYSNRGNEVTVGILNKNDEYNEIKLDRFEDNTAPFIANLITRENFADFYLKLKEESFEKEKVKEKNVEKEVEIER